MDNMTFHEQLEHYTQSGDGSNANRLLMQELGRILVKSKSDFVALLSESGISADENMSDAQLVKLFLDNISRNRKLVLGTALLTNIHNKSMGFDGEEEVNDCGVKQAFNVMQDYFDDGRYDDFSNEEYANAGGVVGAIAGAVGEGAKLGGKIADNRHAKKYGAQDALTKKLDAKNQITQSIIEQRKAQIAATQKKIDAQKKIQKIALISGAVLAGLGIIGFIIYKTKKK